MGVAAGGIRFSLLGRPEEDDARSVVFREKRIEKESGSHARASSNTYS
jgi:hypothetical protein